MFIAALLPIARRWKQPKCPSTNEWIKKTWYIYAMDYYSVIKRNKVGSFVEMWMDLESVIQSKVRKTNIVYQCICVEFRKMVQVNRLAGQEQRHRYREHTCVCGEGWGEGEGWTNLEISNDTYTLPCVEQIASGNCCIAQEAQLAALC